MDETIFTLIMDEMLKNYKKYNVLMIGETGTTLVPYVHFARVDATSLTEAF
ncbi:hypothetical protein [Candidatus Karelsulcia muelleri]|uniref:hypothetical protein n=1 Tax=Candidatus Karelsulcia muelleri TaxID=336810 RepID=UPI001EF4D0A6|nr:hypothetical protein [Candidatus Karelsulcia muelleri]